MERRSAMRPFDLLQPQTVDEAVALLAAHGDDARVVAGGAMLMILLRQRLIAPRALVSITEIPGLAAIEANGGGLRIGANATLRSLERSPEVAARFPVLREALGVVAN